MGIEVYDNKVKKKQRRTIINQKPNMYLDIFNRGVEEVSHWQYYCCWLKRNPDIVPVAFWLDTIKFLNWAFACCFWLAYFWRECFLLLFLTVNFNCCVLVTPSTLFDCLICPQACTAHRLRSPEFCSSASSLQPFGDESHAVITLTIPNEMKRCLSEWVV